ncbi:MAG: hypothetical protein Q8R26_03220 [bacterium]|nr:hypothetical protein [bacterium]
MPRMMDISSKNGEEGTRSKRNTNTIDNMPPEQTHTPPHGSKKLLKLLLFVVVIVLAGKILMYFHVLPSNSFPSVDANKWQTVFLQNGQAYFGHLKEVNRSYVTLSSVYYLQNNTAIKGKDSFVIQKHGNEIHAPENTMYIPKAQILFWENISADSGVLSAIVQNELQQK